MAVRNARSSLARLICLLRSVMRAVAEVTRSMICDCVALHSSVMTESKIPCNAGGYVSKLVKGILETVISLLNGSWFAVGSDHSNPVNVVYSFVRMAVVNTILERSANCA